MKLFLIGIFLIKAAVFSVLPPDKFGFGLGLWDYVITFLYGMLPILALLIGIFMLAIGIIAIMANIILPKFFRKK